jgi:hypothetical protein
MNRLLTTLVQLAIVIPALYMGRMVLRDMRAEYQQLKKSN